MEVIRHVASIRRQDLTQPTQDLPDESRSSVRQHRPANGSPSPLHAVSV